MTGPHGLRDLVSGRAVTAALGREITRWWDRLGTEQLQQAALCASTLHTVTPSALAAALQAFTVGDQTPSGAAKADPQQLVLELLGLGILVPVEPPKGFSHIPGEGWRVPQAIAEGLKLHFPAGFGYRKYRAALLACLADRRDLLGEQLIQARRAARWEYLVELVASRYHEVLTDFRPQALVALDRLPRSVEQQAPLLRFIRLHISYLFRSHAQPRVSATRPATIQGLPAVAAEMVMGVQSLRPDFLIKLSTSNEAAVTAGYMMFAYCAQGRFKEAVDLGHEAQRRLSVLASQDNQLSKQADDFFRFHRGVALCLGGSLTAGAEQFDLVSAPDLSAKRPTVPQLAADYEALIWGLMSGDRTVRRESLQPPVTAAGGYLRALRSLDLLETDEAERCIAPFEDSVTVTSLWPLMVVIEHWISLLKVDDRWWNRRFTDLQRQRTSHLRGKGLGHQATRYMHGELLLSRGRLQQAKALVTEGGAGLGGIELVEARIWLMAGEFGRAIDVAEKYTYDMQMPVRARAHFRLLAAAARWAEGSDHKQAERDFAAGAEICAAVGTVLPLALLPDRYRREALRILAEHPFWEEIASRDPRGSLTAEELRQRVLGARSVFPSQATMVDLTSREMEVLKSLRSNCSMQQIAAAECRALSTVKKQAQAAYRKLGVNSREAALQKAHELGLLNG
ncbi:helix-turn-helix transcriptional regulator [Nesterenkonia haasae]|uniref:helix-turn-helix transcriptional regulator n=1 Tax=Nesterenkonia haasae TaxID=2587813 RepID=UPI00139111FA|nr:LuxR C-terminal-related transcriptional regulator [Nesterenkonia haasae]